MKSGNKSEANKAGNKGEKIHPVNTLFLTGKDKYGAGIISNKLRAHDKSDDKVNEKAHDKVNEKLHEKVKEKREKTEERLNVELPASLIPGQKEFLKKRLEDIENKKNDVQRKRDAPSGSVRSPAIVKASLKLVNKIFKKKK